MTTKFSYSNIERELLPEFRKKLNNSEDVIDVSNNFSYTVTNLLEKIFDNSIDIKDNDVTFSPENDSFFKFSQKIGENNSFKETLESSDLGNVISRFADASNHRYIHLKKHNEKTNSKIK